jgi:hypothetical protein
VLKAVGIVFDMGKRKTVLFIGGEKVDGRLPKLNFWVPQLLAARSSESGAMGPLVLAWDGAGKFKDAALERTENIAESLALPPWE